MSQLFSPRANRIARGVLLAAVLAMAMILLAGFALQRSAWVTGVGTPVVQPQPFDHQRHAALGMDCRYCHTSVEQAAFAGMPSAGSCINCHKLVLASSPGLAPVWQSFNSGKPLVWNRVHDLPQFVHFDHSIHLNGGIGCPSCHGRVDQMAVVQKESVLTMGECLDCHRAPEKFQRPRDQVFDMNWVVAEDSAQSLPVGAASTQKRLLDCYLCHR